jgi:hypothetical protein
MANSLTIILYGGNVDELRCGQDTKHHLNKYLKLTVLFPEPVGPMTLEDNNTELLCFHTINDDSESKPTQ